MPSFLRTPGIPLSVRQRPRRKTSFILAIKALHCLESGTYFCNKGFLADCFLSLIFSKSNRKYFQAAATRLVTLHCVFQSNGAHVPLNHWKDCGWRELAQISEAAASLGLLISLLAHQFTGQKQTLHGILYWKSSWYDLK